ncbi:MAG: DNA primase, partial [Eggerthellaceae bacterium]|nr:DNA primase [Eggerthellaceae bacterium]
IEDAKPIVAYGLDRRLARFDLTSAEGRSKALSSALKVLAPIKGSLLAKDYAVQLAGRLKLREQDVLDELAKVRAPRRYRDESDGENTPRASAEAPAEPDASLPAEGALTQTERNRRSVEREMLGLCAQFPAIALEHADALAQTNWHEQLHADLAQAILACLSENAASTPAEIVAAATAAVPRAAGILTEAHVQDQGRAAQVIAYLADELSIGDMEGTVEALKASLTQAKEGDSGEYELIFQSIVELQREILKKRTAHKPIM